MNSFEVARLLRVEHKRPVLMAALSGYGQGQDQAEALKAGLGRYMVKPVNLHELKNLFAALGPQTGELRGS